MFRIRIAATLSLSVVTPFVLPSQAAGTPPAAAVQSALTKLSGGNYSGALPECQALVKQFPAFARGHMCVGIALVGLGRSGEALAEFDEGEKRGAPVAQAAFRKGMAHAAMGHADAAFRELRRATDAGMVGPPVPPDTDPAFARVRDDPRLKEFVTAMDRNARPCHYDARFREFDFWIGDWDVRPNGAPPSQAPSRNVVTVEQDECVIMEHWTAPLSNGQSFNLFDRSYGVWRQTWVDNSGGQHDYRGSLVNGNMVLRGELPPAPGQTARVDTRLTFFPLHKDTVRQFSESTTDGGRTWTTVYDLIYTRRRP